MTAPHPIILLYVSRNVRINLENLTKRCFKSCKIMMRVKMRIVMQRNQSISIYLLSMCTLSISNSASPVTSMTEDTATGWAGTQDRCCLSIHPASPRLSKSMRGFSNLRMCFCTSAGGDCLCLLGLWRGGEKCIKKRVRPADRWLLAAVGDSKETWKMVIVKNLFI